MKAITLWQPWASLIADGRKPEETRPRPWRFNGLVAICAGKYVDREAAIRFGYDPDKIPTGVVVCVAHKVGCLRFPSCLCPPNEYGNFDAGRFGYPFSAVRKTKHVPVKGRQGIFELDDNLIVYDGLPVILRYLSAYVSEPLFSS